MHRSNSHPMRAETGRSQGGASESTARPESGGGQHSSATIVSVILPTFNRLRFLRPAIESVYAQTFPDWELIIADDGSELETRQYLQSLASDPRVTVVWLPHSGRPSMVRNAALLRAVGEYVAFLDSDDLWAAQKLERQIETLRARANCRWSYTAFLRVDGAGNPLPEEKVRPWLPYEGDIFEQVVTTRASIRTPSVLATRQLIAQAGGFDEAMPSAEDYDLWLRLALYSEVALVDEPLVYVRLHDENHTRDWQSAYAGRDRSLSRSQQLVDAGRRSLLREERTRNALKLAAIHAERGAHGRMLRALWESLPYSWTYPRWWLSALKTVLRPHLSPRLLVLFREHRRGARSAADN
jgi:glycosyltransferase involved in cell wall biosynthesis